MNVPNNIRTSLQAARTSGAAAATQRALAAALGVDEARMSRIVSGEIVPSRAEVDTMARYLGCEPTDLYPATSFQALQTLWEAAAADQATG